MTQQFTMTRMIAVLLGLALAHAAEAQPAPPPQQPAKPAAQTKPAPKPPAKPRPESAAKTGAKSGAQSAAASGPCGIGVISHVGEVSIQQVGIMVFGNDLKEVPVPGWGLDDLVVARVRAAAGPRGNVRKIAYAPGAFAPYDRPEATLFRNPEKDLTSVVQAVAKTAGCERYVVVVQGGSQFMTTNQTVNGIGVVSYAGVRTYLFVLTSIYVYDGRSFAVLKRGAGGGRYVPFSDMFGGTGIRGPSREMKGLPWPPAPDAFRDEARSMLSESLDKGVAEVLAP